MYEQNGYLCREVKQELLFSFGGTTIRDIKSKTTTFKQEGKTVPEIETGYDEYSQLQGKKYSANKNSKNGYN